MEEKRQLESEHEGLPLNNRSSEILVLEENQEKIGPQKSIRFCRERV